MYKTVANVFLCCAFAVAAFFACFAFSSQQDVAFGATASVTVNVDSESQLPFDLDYALNVMDENGKVVKTLNFNGIPESPSSFSLTVGQKYSLAVYLPTSVFCTIILGGSIELNSNYVGNDFVMPSGGVVVLLALNTQNPSIFTNTTTI